MYLSNFTISGMTCSSCALIIKDLFKEISGIKDISINHLTGETIISSDYEIKTEQFIELLKKYPKYKIEQNQIIESKKTWFQTYKPVLILFFYLLIISLIIGFKTNKLELHIAMNTFMAGFFIAFSYFKLLNLNAFASSYAMYDIIAMRFKNWGYIYAFLELLLGFLYIIDFNPLYLNSITALVMSVSLIGVIKSVMNKKKIQCACLGTVFNLPMSTLTIVEDSIMILMSLVMLILI